MVNQKASRKTRLPAPYHFRPDRQICLEGSPERNMASSPSVPPQPSRRRQKGKSGEPMIPEEEIPSLNDNQRLSG